MKKSVIAVLVATFVTLTAGSALAEDIAGRFGITGRLGFLIPADSETVGPSVNVDTDAGFIGGGGVIFGIDKNIAVEIDVTHTSFDGNVGGQKIGEFSTTNISLGAQYRFDVASRQVTPYLGAGVDLLINDFEDVDGFKYDVDTTAGIHLSGGVDFFVTRELAITAEAKLVVAPDADVSFGGVKELNYDPMNFNTTVGVRYFFN